MNSPDMIYFDNSASAKVNPSAAAEACRYLNVCANPSSIHFAGIAVRKDVEASRKDVADALKCSPAELTFTSGGTESNNIAILSSAYANRRAGNIIVTTEAEHPSVLQTMDALVKRGYVRKLIPVTGGTLDYGALEGVLAEGGVCLTALMQANNQNGAVTDLKRVREIITRTGSRTLFHSDIVQGFMKVGRPMAAYASRYCDTASLSAHKIGGLKGTGALFVRKGLHLEPVMYGGGQENGLRNGTENTVGIIAFGVAAREYSCGDFGERVSALRRLFTERADALLGENISYRVPDEHIDALISISLKNVKSEVALNYLSSKGICVSAVSACSSHAKKNQTLAAFGYGEEYISSSLRIGFSPFNTADEVIILTDELKNALRYHK